MEEQAVTKMSVPVTPRTRDDNLERIRRKEAEIAARVGAAREQADRVVAEARAEAEARIREADELTVREAAEREAEIIAEAEREAELIRREGEAEMAALAARVASSSGHVVASIMERVIGH